jgi:hypothetical protein
MEKLKSILIKNDYKEVGVSNIYVKNEKAYISQIELKCVDMKHVNFIMKR